MAFFALAAVCGAQERREIVKGRVLDWQGKPVAGVPIVHDPLLEGRLRLGTGSKLVALSSADGSFEVELARYRGEFVTQATEWATLVPCKLGGPVDREYVVVAPNLNVHGRVVDARGRPVRGARVVVRLDPKVRAALPATNEEVPEVLASTRTDARGAFAFVALALPPGAMVEATCMPLRPAVGTVAAEVELVLWDPAVGLLVEGVALEPDGRPAAGASIRVGSEYQAYASDDGRFRLHCAARAPLPFPLVAKHAGYQPVIIRELAPVKATERTAWVELEFAARELCIQGLVFDAAEKPIRSGLVRVCDPTRPFQGSWYPWDVIEDATAEIETGQFTLCGLLDREYVLDVVTYEPWTQFRSQSIRAGANDIVLRVPEDAAACPLAGRVRAPDGTPLFGVNVVVTFREPGGRLMWPIEHLSRFPHLAPQTWSDAEGRFELHRVACKLAVVVVSGDELLPQALDVASLDREKPLDLVVRRVARFQLEGLDDGLDSVEFELVDSRGQPARQESSAWPFEPVRTALPMNLGMSEELAIAEGSYRLTVVAGGRKLIDAREIVLVAGETLVVTP